MRSKHCLSIIVSAAFFIPQAHCQDASQADLVKQVYGAKRPWEHPYKYGDLIQPKAASSEAGSEIEQSSSTLAKIPELKFDDALPECDKASDILKRNFVRFAPNRVLHMNDSASGLLMIENGIPTMMEMGASCVAGEANSTIKLSFRNLRLSPDFTAHFNWVFKLEHAQPSFSFRPCSKEEIGHLNLLLHTQKHRKEAENRIEPIYSELGIMPTSQPLPARF